MYNQIGVCSKCGNRAPIVNKKYNLCPRCNRKRLDEQKGKGDEVNYKAEETVKWYRFQFDNKPPVCEECGEPLPKKFMDGEGNIIMRSQYSHILTKSAHPEFRFAEWNCNRLCFDHHFQWEFQDRTKMKIYDKNKKLVIEKTGLDLIK